MAALVWISLLSVCKKEIPNENWALLVLAYLKSFCRTLDKTGWEMCARLEVLTGFTSCLFSWTLPKLDTQGWQRSKIKQTVEYTVCSKSLMWVLVHFCQSALQEEWSGRRTMPGHFVSFVGEINLFPDAQRVERTGAEAVGWCRESGRGLNLGDYYRWT